MSMDFMISQFCEEDRTQVMRTSRLSEHSILLDEEDGENQLPPEMELGNVEYKAKLINPSKSRLQHLITQMKWRLREGQGEAIYEIGVEDGGAVSGLTDFELSASINTLKKMALALDANIVVLTERDVTPRLSLVRRRAVEVLVRRVPENRQFIELRLAILGGCDVGKSTLCGVLAQGGLDNGHGSKRQNLFRYLHEIHSGKTSSVCLDVFGFNSRGKLVNQEHHSLDEVVEQSQKIVTLIDLAGEIKYIKTTIQGLSGYKPHYACLLISAEAGPTHATREHLALARLFSIQFFIIITKRDAVDKSRLDEVYRQVSSLIARAGMEGGVARVKTKRDAVRACTEMSQSGIVPVLAISCVTGEGHKALRTFLNCLPATDLNTVRQAELSAGPAFFSIEEVYQVSHVGSVACGMLSEGRLNEGDAVLVGPARDGGFEMAEITSLRRSRQPVRSVLAGEGASIALRFLGVEVPLRRGTVIVAKNSKPRACMKFSARVLLLCHAASEIAPGFTATLHIGSVCQTARFVKIHSGSLLQGVWADVDFEFVSYPEVVREGTPLMFRQGRTKGMGEVSSIRR